MLYSEKSQSFGTEFEECIIYIVKFRFELFKAFNLNNKSISA